MGTMIHLSVGNLDIDWGKNEYFSDHSPLYQVSDVANVPFWYVKESEIKDLDDNWELYADYNEGLSAPLYKVVDRLHLLGYTFKNCEKEYNYQIKSSYFEEDEDLGTFSVSFNELKDVFKTLEISELLNKNSKTIRTIDKAFNQQILDRIILSRRGREFAIREYFGGMSSEEGFHPYTFLNLLSLNKAALETSCYLGVWGPCK